MVLGMVCLLCSCTPAAEFFQMPLHPSPFTLTLYPLLFTCQACQASQRKVAHPSRIQACQKLRTCAVGRGLWTNEMAGQKHPGNQLVLECRSAAPHPLDSQLLSGSCNDPRAPSHSTLSPVGKLEGKRFRRNDRRNRIGLPRALVTLLGD